MICSQKNAVEADYERACCCFAMDCLTAAADQAESSSQRKVKREGQSKSVPFTRV